MKEEDILEWLAPIIIFIFSLALFIPAMIIGLKVEGIKYKEFINYCEKSNNIRIVDNSKIEQVQVVRRQYLVPFEKYKIVNEERKHKDIKLYFDNTLMYDLKEYPVNNIKNNKITNCKEFYLEYVE